jgi:hypothetical protein
MPNFWGDQWLISWLDLGVNIEIGVKIMLDSDENNEFFYICLCFDILKLC